MIKAFTVCVFAVAACGLAQTDGDAWLRSPEGQAAIRELADKYGITAVTQPYRQPGDPVITSVQSVLDWVDVTYGGGRWSVSADGREFVKWFRITHGSPGKSEWVQITVYLSPSYEGAEKTAALSMSFIALPKNFSKGAFSGGTIGDWSYNDYFEGRHATLRFLRRNVVVWVTYEAASEALPDKKIRQTPDPSIKGKCEQIAREIDQRLTMLPAGAK